MKQFGEILRRVTFNTLDKVQGGRKNRLKEVTKNALMNGVTDAYVDRRVRMITDYAKEHSEFFRQYKDAKELTDFPVMDKMSYLKVHDQVMSDEFKGRKDELVRYNTSGSTGDPFAVYANREKDTRMRMAYMAIMELCGFRIGMKRMEFRVWIPGKNMLSKFQSTKINLVMMDISNMGDDSLKNVCETIRRKRIQCLVLYSSALTHLTAYIKKYDVDVSKWAVEVIYTMGEGCPQATFDLTKEIFGFVPIRSYGNNEQGHVCVELNGEGRYTIDLYNYYVEMLKIDSDEPAEPGELGRIVITDYYNRAFPMIRYDTGDTAVYEEMHDRAGRKHAYFTEIYGRRGSMMYNTKGEPLSIHVFLNVLLDLEGIVYQAKCIQWEKKRYELVLNADRSRLNEKAVVDSYRHYLGEDAVIDVTYVDEIPVQASGKTMACEQKCPDYMK